MSWYTLLTHDVVERENIGLIMTVVVIIVVEYALIIMSASIRHVVRDEGAEVVEVLECLAARLGSLLQVVLSSCRRILRLLVEIENTFQREVRLLRDVLTTT